MSAGTIENGSQLQSEDAYVFPASFAQRRLWFLDQLVPGNAFYNLGGTIPLNVRIDPSLFARCLNEVVRRHETLRTTFDTSSSGEVLQVIKPDLVIPMPVLDLRSLPPEDRNSQLRDAAILEAGQPFDLREGPLIRARIVTQGEAEHVLLITFHHIISDGWSMGVLWREMIALYAAFQQGLPSPLPELPIQYADYTEWQRKWLRGDVYRRQLEYWTSKLSHLTVLQLPADRRRPAMLSYSGGSCNIVFPPKLVEDLRALSQSKGVTLFMTLLAAFQILLQRYSAQDDIVVGTPVAGRNRRELEPLIGFFVNTVVMRTDLSGDPTFQEVLQAVRLTTLEAYANQDLPFEKLVEKLQPDRDLSSNPLFRVSFQLFSAPAGIGSSSGGIPEASFQRFTSVFDLACNLVDGTDTLSGVFEFSTDLFDSQTIEHMATHFQTLLESIVENPGQQISKLEIIPSSERDMLLQLSAGAEYGHGTSMPVLEAVRTFASEAPDAIAVTCEDASCTYRELDELSGQIAGLLQRHRVLHGSVVGICVDRSIGMVAAMLAVWRTGAAYLPLDPASPPDRIEFMLRDAGAAAVLCDTKSNDGLSGCAVPLIDMNAARSLDGRNEAPERAFHPEDLAYVIYTSGSTGIPKGVEITHRGLGNLVSWHNATYNVSPWDRATQVAGAGYDACVWELWPYFAAGASVHIANDYVRLQADELAKWMADQVITLAFLPTPLAAAFLDQPLPAGLHLRVLMTGGEKLHRGPKYPVPFDIVNHYGPTEYTVVTTCASVNADDSRDGYKASPPIGRPIHNTHVYLLDSIRRLVPFGLPGELCVGGVGLARGYRNRPALTAESFIPDEFSGVAGARLYRTRDLVRFRPDGQLEFLGRVDSQVKIRGSRVELGEIEAAILQHPAVRQVAVVEVSSGSGTQATTLAAHIVGSAGELPSCVELRRFLQRSLPEYMIPSKFFAAEALPLTRNGKVDRDALPPPDDAQPLNDPEIDQGRDTLEELLAEIWADLLALDQVGIHQNFFTDLGGHSLLATQLVSRMRQTLQIDFPLQRIFEAPTIAEFGATIRQNPAEWTTVEAVISVLLQLENMSDEEVSVMLENGGSDSPGANV
jgi:amino acid adenylation domain-containing protein